MTDKKTKRKITAEELIETAKKNMIKDVNSLLDKFLQIGFVKFKSTKKTGIGYIREYSYYPSYMTNFYKLVIFTYNHNQPRFTGDVITNGSEFILYLHNIEKGEKDKKAIEILFQRRFQYHQEYLNSELNRIFKIELRDIKLHNILK